MRVKFAKTTYDEVRVKRGQMLRESIDDLQSLKETSRHYLFNRLPALCIFLFYAELILKKVHNPCQYTDIKIS